MPSFSALMRARRQERGLSLAQLAAEVGYHSSYLSMVERGIRQIDERGVVRIAEVLGIDPQEALLATLRDRLPEDLRKLVPSRTGTRSADADLHVRLARELQAEHFDFEVDALRLAMTIDWDGNYRLVRSFEGCRPNAAGRPVWQISFRDRLAGHPGDPGVMYPKLTVRQEPEGLEYVHTSEVADSRHHHHLFFPKGWRRAARRGADTFSFVFETYQEGAFALDASSVAAHPVPPTTLHDPLNGSYSNHLLHYVRLLEMTVDFPRGYQPQRWEVWAWWGPALLTEVPRNLADKRVCRSLELETRGGHARLLAAEPLAGYSFAVVWAPADRQAYLEARHGIPSD